MPDWKMELRSAMKIFTTCCAKPKALKQAASLHPLTPTFLEDQHRPYLKRIHEALNDHDVRSIALTGSYGTGKSSILDKLELESRKRVVKLSLSTLWKQPDNANNSKEQTKADTLTTQRIQKELVKQLLYSEKPHNIRGSRFRRIERFRIVPAVAWSTVIAVAISSVAFLAGWMSKLQEHLTARIRELGEEFADVTIPFLYADGLILCVAFGIVLGIYRLLHGRMPPVSG